MKPILVIGQAPSRSSDPGLPLQGYSGDRLLRAAALTWDEAVVSCDFVNLLNRWPGSTGDSHSGDRFPESEARSAMSRLLLSGAVRGRDAVLLLGRNVARCAGMGHEPPLAWLSGWMGSSRAGWIPHPSGANHWWNSDENREAARRFLADLPATRMRLLQVLP